MVWYATRHASFHSIELVIILMAKGRGGGEGEGRKEGAGKGMGERRRAAVVLLGPVSGAAPAEGEEEGGVSKHVAQLQLLRLHAVSL